MKKKKSNKNKTITQTIYTTKEIIPYKTQKEKTCPLCHRGKNVQEWTTNKELTITICRSCDYNYKNGTR